MTWRAFLCLEFSWFLFVEALWKRAEKKYGAKHRYTFSRNGIIAEEASRIAHTRNDWLAPNFNKSVVETLAKRAANWCSNPDCRTLTSGPSETPEKAVNIGEAAHIYGAKEGAARYRASMTDTSRSEITNGIWLCRNCHKLIDNDPNRFSAELLFEWRNIHENFVISQVGTQNENLRSQLLAKEILPFAEDSPRARQIVHDRPDFWEYSLTAELLNGYLKKPLRKWRDLQRGLYVKDILDIDDSGFSKWLSIKMSEISRLIGSLALLYSEELREAWGMPGEQGDPMEIRHVCRLIEDASERLVRWEEDVRFIETSEDFDRLTECFPGCAGIQLDELSRVPDILEEGVEWAFANPGKSRKIDHKINFELPENWSNRVNSEIRRVEKKMCV
jgi:hypothetical protein